MFTKNFKSKASNNLKSSYRKTLVQKLKEKYPVLTEDDLKEIIPIKASLCAIKIVNSAGESACVYTVDNAPFILEMNDIFYPTVYALWKCPHMLTSIIVESHLAPKLQDGLIHVRRSLLPSFGNRIPHFLKGAVLSVNTEDNEAAVLVGIAQYSSSDILIVQNGVCIKTMNIVGDYLLSHEKFVKIERPQLKPPSPYFAKPNIENSIEGIAKMTTDDVEQLETVTNNVNNDAMEYLEDNIETEENVTMNETDMTINNNEFPDDMDGLLKYCLLCVLKVNGKKLQLPLKTNLLYANHMASFCPSDKTLDVKKSSHKKMAKFLEAMESEGFLQIKEIEKGVDAVISVNLNHEVVRNHYVIFIEDNEPQANDSTFKPPSVREVYKITAAVVPLFKHHYLKKGQTVPASDVRSCLVDYVRYNNLQDLNNKNLIKIDPFLGTFTNSSTTISWEDIMSAMLKKMTACSELRYADGKAKLLTGQLKHITMQVANRSGNKKVTIVSNLEDYGISLTALSKECQHGVAASCSITRTPGSKTDQLLVQGNQQYFIAKHLTEVYGLPKRFIDGADKILAKKKK